MSKRSRLARSTLDFVANEDFQKISFSRREAAEFEKQGGSRRIKVQDF